MGLGAGVRVWQDRLFVGVFNDPGNAPKVILPRMIGRFAGVAMVYILKKCCT